MIKVLMINPVGAMGGAEWSLFELAVALAGEPDLDLSLALPPGELSGRISRAGIRHLPITGVRLHKPREPGRTWRDLRCFFSTARELSSIVAGTGPRIIHANGTTAALLSARIPSPAGKHKHLWHCRDLMRGRLPAHLCARHQDLILAPSGPVRERLAALLPPRLANRTILVANGIALDRFKRLASRAAARHRLGWPETGPIICMIAHFVPWKRHDLFLDCLAGVLRHYPSALGVIAGGDPYGDNRRLGARIRQAGRGLEQSGRLLFTGASVAAPDILAASDLLVHPAAEEPFGRVICEAMAAGCPPVAAAAAGPGRIIEHRRTGWLCPPEDPSALAAAVIKLLADDQLRLRLGEAGRVTVGRRHDIHATASRIASLYRRLAGGGYQPGHRFDHPAPL